MKKIFLILSVGFLMTSCATIFTGSSEMITINSNVKGTLYERKTLGKNAEIIRVFDRA